MIRNIIILVAMMSFLSCKTTQNLTTVKEVDIARYAGQWYEIARLPNSFEKGLECVTATYTLKKSDKIEVLNKGYSIEKVGKLSTAKGRAWVLSRSKELDNAIYTELLDIAKVNGFDIDNVIKVNQGYE